MISRQYTKFQISPMKHVRGVAGTRSDGRKDGRNDGQTDRLARVISIVPRLCQVTKNWWLQKLSNKHIRDYYGKLTKN